MGVCKLPRYEPGGRCELFGLWPTTLTLPSDKRVSLRLLIAPGPRY
jgi:hypothetical protein